MIYTAMTKKALQLCFQAHKEQVDKSGIPYVFHPFHLAEQMKCEDCVIAALLHDVAEDTAYSLQYIENMGFSPDVLTALKLLTHDKSEPYMEYVCRVACNPIAKAVKLADLTHNSDLSRLDSVTGEDRRRVAKYKIMKQILKNTVSHEGVDSITGKKFTHYSTIPISKRYNVFFSSYFTREEFISCRIDVELEDDCHFSFSREAYRTLSEILGGNISFPEQLVQFYRKHQPYELEYLIQNIPHESTINY